MPNPMGGISDEVVSTSDSQSGISDNDSNVSEIFVLQSEFKENSIRNKAVQEDVGSTGIEPGEEGELRVSIDGADEVEPYAIEELLSDYEGIRESGDVLPDEYITIEETSGLFGTYVSLISTKQDDDRIVRHANSISANVADVISKIDKYGSTMSTGKAIIKTIDDSLFAIIHDSNNGTLSFISSIKTANYTSGSLMTYDLDKNDVVNGIYAQVENKSGETLYSMTASIDVSTYTKDTVLSFSSTNQSLNELGSTIVRQSVLGWGILLIEETFHPLSDIGFIAFDEIPDNSGVVDSGVIGSISWEISDEYVLTIGGTGAITTTVEKPWIDYKDKIVSINITEGITSIEANVFKDYTKLLTLTTPNSLKNIKESCFRRCTNLNNVLFSEGVEEIGEMAFFVTGIKTINIPASVKSIGLTAFHSGNLIEFNVVSENQNYKSLGGVLFKKDETSLIMYPGGKSEKVYYVPDKVQTISEEAFWGSDYLEKIIIGDNIENIGRNAFTICMKLTDISVSDNNRYFSSEDGVLFDKLKTKIVACPYRKRIETYSVPATVKTIGAYSFSDASFSSIAMTNVEVIEEYAFEDCDDLRNVTLPASLKSIGEEGFDEFSEITDVYYGGTREQWNSISFGDGVLDAFQNATIHYTEPKTSSFTVRFITNGGSSVGQQVIDEGNLATRPQNPVKDGFIFDDWYTDAGFNIPFDFSTRITQNTILYANWIKKDETKYYNVEFYSDGTLYKISTVEAGKTVSWPEQPKRDGFDFGGWYADDTFKSVFDFNTVISGNTKIYAKWTKSTPEPEPESNHQTIVVGQKIELQNACFPNVTEAIQKFTTSDKKIASVSRNFLTGKKIGRVTVTAYTYAGKTYSANVTVVSKPKLKFSIPLTYAGQEINANDYFITSDTADANISYWESSKGSVVYVVDAENGIIEAVGAGTAKITAYFGEKGASGTVKVSANITVKFPQFAKTSYKILTGGKLTVTMKNVKAEQNPVWAIEDPDMVSISPIWKNGKPTGKIELNALQAGDTALMLLLTERNTVARFMSQSQRCSNPLM
ncbi:MAG: leucine-rich repeat protein [Lachnospiraceae bacterium]|nr:leucine-rich repeat protein [Lachnospiraceae bacterium]